MLNVLWIKLIKNCIDQDTWTVLVCSLAMSHMDNSNSFLLGITDESIYKMQHVHNAAEKVALKKNRNYLVEVEQGLNVFGYQLRDG